jgi:hypothetical protein
MRPEKTGEEGEEAGRRGWGKAPSVYHLGPLETPI